MARKDEGSASEKVPLLDNPLENEQVVSNGTSNVMKEGAGQADKKVEGDPTHLTNPDASQKHQTDKECEGEKEGDENDEQKKEPLKIRIKDIGIWRVFYQDKPWSYIPGVELVRQFKDIADTLPYVWRFTKEIWNLAPGYLLLWGFLRVWESIDSAISLWVTAKLLDTVCPVTLSSSF